MKRFGLIGKTLKHSFSKNYFEKKFITEGILECTYDNFELSSIEEVTALIHSNVELKGFNVTIPYKEAIVAFLDHKNELVKKIGACNCVKISNGHLHGYNTDAAAFTNSLQPHIRSHHACALILGSGGASKAVQASLQDMDIDFLVVSRNKRGHEIGYEDVGEEMISQHLLIINTTPVGMYPDIDNDPSIPYEALTQRHLLYDLVYNPEKTKFLKQGEQRGASIVNGAEMLRLQAEESWKIWNT